jgi:hypothetical protein
MSAIIMTEEYWATSPFSIARYYGGIKIRGVEYVIVNKEGKDIYECSIEAEKAGREKAIEPGEPADLIDRRYIPMYKKLGRDKFIEWVKEGLDLTAMKERIKNENKK